MESLFSVSDTDAYSRSARMTMKYTKLKNGESNGNIDHGKLDIVNQSR